MSAEWGIVAGAALAVVAGGFLPWISAEVALLGAAALLPPEGHLPLVLACAAAQMVAKTSVWGMARRTPGRLPGRALRLPDWMARLGTGTRVWTGLVFTGALFSIPPFYLVTVISARTRLTALAFVLAGTAGVLARYGALVQAYRVVLTP